MDTARVLDVEEQPDPQITDKMIVENIKESLTLESASDHVGARTFPMVGLRINERPEDFDKVKALVYATEKAHPNAKTNDKGEAVVRSATMSAFSTIKKWQTKGWDIIDANGDVYPKNGHPSEPEPSLLDKLIKLQDSIESKLLAEFKDLSDAEKTTFVNKYQETWVSAIGPHIPEEKAGV